MVRVAFLREGSAYYGFEARGHAGYGMAGADVACAAVSAVLLTALLGIERVIGAKPSVSRDDGSGYLRATVGRGASDSERQGADLALRIAEAGLSEISREYPGAVRLTIRDGG